MIRFIPKDGGVLQIDRASLYRLFHKAGFTRGCEVGVHVGRNAVEICKNIPDVKLFLIEPFKDHPNSLRSWGDYNPYENTRATICPQLKDYDVTWIEEFSEEAFKRFPDGSLDFVYIDADHTYDFFMLDTILWTRKVRVGGIMSGHDYDYNGRYEPKVTRAINDYTQAHKIPLYYTEHPKDRAGSWFFVKN